MPEVMHPAPSYALRAALAVISLIVGAPWLRDNHRLVVFMHKAHLTVLETNAPHCLQLFTVGWLTCKAAASNKTSLVVSAMNDHLVVSPDRVRRGHLT
jgi:hypothetical protein